MTIKKITEKIIDNSYLICFLFFYIFLIFQFSNVFIYYDDYGYLSLSYGYVEPNVVGHQYSFFQFAEFMYNHYYTANGRLLYAGLLPFVNMFGGIQTVQFIMATIILIVHFIIFYELRKSNKLNNKESLILATLICLLYGLISITLHRQGIYWFAASYLYITPTIMFLIFAKKYYSTIFENGILSKKKQILLVFGAFIVGFSNEQWLSAGVALIICIILFKVYKKVKIMLYDYLILIFCLIGGVPILASPAVKGRMSNNPEWLSLTFIERTWNSTKMIINQLFTFEHKIYLLVLICTFTLLGIYLIKQRKGILIFNVAYVGFSIFLLFEIVTINNTHLSNGNSMYILMLLLYLLLTVIQILVCYWNEKYTFPMFIFIAAFTSVACLTIVPEIPSRVFIPFVLLSFLVIGDLFIKVTRNVTIFSITLIIIVALLSIPNMINIFEGYRDNYKILEYDHEILLDNMGSLEGEVKLKKLNDVLYGSEMLYYEGFEYMEQWMEEYYNLSENVDIIYE